MLSKNVEDRDWNDLWLQLVLYFYELYWLKNLGD